MLHQRLAIDAHALLARAADRLVALLAGDMDDIKRNARHVGDHDGAVGRLALHFRRPRIAVRFGAVIAGRQQLLLELRDDVAVLGMNHRQRTEFGAALERRIHLVVVHHQRALVGHEVLERGDALLDDGGHLVEHLLAPPGDRHVEGIVARRLGRLVVPHLQRFHQRLLRRRQAEVDHHRRAAGQRRARPALEIVSRIGAHEGHFQMRVRVDASGHDIAARRVELLVAGKVRPDGGDRLAVDQDVRLPRPVGGDDGSVLDDFRHSRSPF